jgi:hypothetical protein
MNMRTKLGICGLLLGLAAMSVPVAYAATVTRLVVSGTTTNLSLVTSVPGAGPGCTIDVWVTVLASASVERSNGGTASTGAVGFVQRVDNCTGDFEFGSFNVSLPSTAFSTGTGTVTFNATIPVVMGSFGPAGGTVDRTLVATLRYTNVEDNSVATRTFGRTSSPGITMITRGRSVFNAASISGQLKLDGANLVTSQAAIDSGIETGTSANIEITRS